MYSHTHWHLRALAAIPLCKHTKIQHILGPPSTHSGSTLEDKLWLPEWQENYKLQIVLYAFPFPETWGGGGDAEEECWWGEFSAPYLINHQKNTKNTCRASEGKTVEIEYRGDVERTIQDILGGIRSTCTYVGASKLKELSRRTTFIRVTQQLNEVFNPNTTRDWDCYRLIT